MLDKIAPLAVGASVTVTQLEKHFGGFHALGPINIDIEPGEFVSIIGPSGCGKSTTMLLLAGLLEATKGQIFVGGNPLKGALTDIGIVFQDHLLLDFRTALSNVLLQQEIRHLPRAEQNERARELLAKLGLREEAFDRYPSQLSGGMRQRVSIARALVHGPSMLFMDEPFGALDAITRTQIRRDLELLWLDQQMTVLFITHSIEEAVGLSDRVLIMSQNPGQIIEELKIELARPRPSYLGHQTEFNQYAERIFSIFEKLGVYRARQ